MWMLDYFFIFLTIAEYGIFGHLLAFLIQSTAICTILGEMTDADKIMHPQHSGIDLMDIHIWINLTIRIGIPDDFWLKFWRWWRFVFLFCHCFRCFFNLFSKMSRFVSEVGN